MGAVFAQAWIQAAIPWCIISARPSGAPPNAGVTRNAS